MESYAKLSLVAPAVLPVAPVAASAPAQRDTTKASRDIKDPNANYRLVIEEGPTLGSFVYKTLDSTTGEVVRQFPREQLLRLAEDRQYSAGKVIDTTS